MNHLTFIADQMQAIQDIIRGQKPRTFKEAFRDEQDKRVEMDLDLHDCSGEKCSVCPSKL